MRVANLAGRPVILIDGKAIDVARASQGQFAPEMQRLYDQWSEFCAWAKTANATLAEPYAPSQLGSPTPRPPQLFAIGLNYRDHASEAGLELPARPMVFTKFPACVTGPFAEVVLPPGSVDFEAELVAIIGIGAEHVKAADAWSHVAGLSIGQDLSERELQIAGPQPAQFNMGKSFVGFAPIGPALVTPDEFANPDDLEIGCAINGETMQRSRTGKMIFSVGQVIEFLSSVLPLLPGDAIFMGTPSGIGWARTPKRLLSTRDELVTTIEGIGEMRHRFANRRDRQ